MVITITNEDNMELMDRYNDKYFDLLDADPPYFSGPEKRGFYGKKISSIKVKRSYQKTESWELPTLEWFNEANRVSKNQIIWGGNYFEFIGTPFKTPRGKDIIKWIEENPIGWIVLDKCNGYSSFNDYELAWTSYDIPTYIYKFMWNGILQGKGVFDGHIMQSNKHLNQKRIHPTEKPILLYKHTYHKYTKKGYKVCSPYVGSGADAIASLDFDIEFIGSEKTQIHYEAAMKRLKQHQSQTKLF